MNSLRKNLGYQTLYQILITIMPLITAPYLARTLGAEMQGLYSYTNSIVNYFVLFGMIGVTNHGIRSIAESRKNEYEKSTTFKTIYSIQFFTNIASLLFYSLYLYFIRKDSNIYLSLMQIILILASLIDINWFFFGIEEFKITVKRNIIIKIITLIMILTLVKGPQDLNLYCFLMAFSVFLSNLVLWFYLPRYLNIKSGKISNLKNNLNAALILFVPLFAMSFYHLMDKTMLGIISDYKNVGFYYNADKIINMPIGILIGISNVFFPRMSSLLKENDFEKYKKMFLKNLELMGLIGIIICFGIATIANELVPIFLGGDYSDVSILIIVLAPVVILKSVSICIRYQFLIPNKMEKQFIISTILGSVINLAMNMLLIPKYGALGAVIGTLTAEFAACTYQVVSTKKHISLKNTLYNLLCYSLMGIVMFVSIRIISDIIETSLFNKMLIEILLGAFIFILLLLIFVKSKKQNTIFYYIFNEIKRKKNEKTFS